MILLSCSASAQCADTPGLEKIRLISELLRAPGHDWTAILDNNKFLVDENLVFYVDQRMCLPGSSVEKLNDLKAHLQERLGTGHCTKVGGHNGVDWNANSGGPLHPINQIPINAKDLPQWVR